MKELEYTFLTHELHAQKYIETRLTAYLYDALKDIPTGETIHYFQRPFATGFYCLILPIKPKRGFIAPVGFSSDGGLNELELNLKSNKCLNEPTSTTEPLTPEQKRIITDAAGGSIDDIKAYIRRIMPKVNIDNLQWPEIFANIRVRREAYFEAKLNLLEQKAVAIATKSAADAMAQAKSAAQDEPAKTEPKKTRGGQKGRILPEVKSKRQAVYLFVLSRGVPTGKKDCLYSFASLAEQFSRKNKYISESNFIKCFDIVRKNIDVYFPNGIPKLPEIE